MKKWWSPPGFETPILEVDLREGGKYRLGMRKLPDGELFYLLGAYREVRPPEKVVYTWRWENNPYASIVHDFPETLVTVEFRDLGNSTEVVLTHELLPTDEAREEHNKGWNSCFDRLAKLFQA